MTHHLQHLREGLTPKLLAYVDQLDAAVGEERTWAIVEEIKRDKTIKRAEAIAIARALTGVRARSKAHAIELLSWRHRNVRTTNARILATGHRLAG